MNARILVGVLEWDNLSLPVLLRHHTS